MVVLIRTVPSQDHPRMCGKNQDITVENGVFSGSPPHVREKLFLHLVAKLMHGITPACAGKTCQLLHQYRVHRDHPRVCGKNVSSLMFGYQRPGSPPRVREKQLSQTLDMPKMGITPACAGKTIDSANLQLDK